MNDMSQFSFTSFLNLGKAFKNYAIANIISIASSFIITLVMQATVFIPFVNITSESDALDLVFSMIPIFAVFGVIGFGIGIFVLIRYFQYISALKHAGEDANDSNLTRAYRMELWGLILSITLPIILVIALMVIIPTIINFIYSGYDPYNPSISEDDIISAIIGPVMSIILLVLLVSLTTIIFQIAAKFAIDNWATGIRNAYSGNLYAINLQEGTNFMKWGVVVQICFGSIGSILFIIGLYRAGKNAFLLFNTSPEMAPIRTQSQPYSGYGTGPGFQSYYQPDTSGPTIRPSTNVTGSKICPACGAILPDPNMRFCTNCGRPL